MLLRSILVLLEASESAQDVDTQGTTGDGQEEGQTSIATRAKRFARDLKLWFDDLRNDYVLINMIFIASSRLVLMVDVFTDAALSADEIARANALAASSPAQASLHMNSGLTLFAIIILPYFLMTAFMFPIHPMINVVGSEEFVTFESLDDVSVCFCVVCGVWCVCEWNSAETDTGSTVLAFTTQYIPEDTYGPMALPLRAAYATTGGYVWFCCRLAHRVKSSPQTVPPLYTPNPITQALQVPGLRWHARLSFSLYGSSGQPAMGPLRPAAFDLRVAI